MTSPELIKLKYQTEDANPETRMAACEKMWELGDPEAIGFLVEVYQEDEDEEVRLIAEDVLSRFRHMEKEMKGEAVSKADSGDGGGGILKAFLTISLLALIAANAVFFVMNSSDDEDETGSTGPRSRQQLLAEVSTSLDNVISDSAALIEEMQAVEAGQKLIVDACRRDLARPQQVQLTPAEVELYPDIHQFVSDGDYPLSFQGFAPTLDSWDGICEAEEYRHEGYSGRLQGVSDIAVSARDVGLAVLTGQPPSDSQTAPVGRQGMIDQVSTTLDAIVSDATGLQEELRKATQDATEPDCSRQFFRPTPVQVVETEAQLYPEIQAFITDEINFGLDGLQLAFDFWDNTVCADLQYQPEDVMQHVQRLAIVTDAAMSARDQRFPALTAGP